MIRSRDGAVVRPSPFTQPASGTAVTFRTSTRFGATRPRLLDFTRRAMLASNEAEFLIDEIRHLIDEISGRRVRLSRAELAFLPRYFVDGNEYTAPSRTPADGHRWVIVFRFV